MIDLGRLKLESEAGVVDARSKVRDVAELLRFTELEASRLAAILSESARSTRALGGAASIDVALEVDGGSRPTTTLVLTLRGAARISDLPHVDAFFDSSSEFIDRDKFAIELRRRAARFLERPSGAFIEELRTRIKKLSKADKLLRVILPDPIAEELTNTEAVATKRHDEVAVIFSDVVGFTSFCDGKEPDEVVECLQEFSRSFESVAERHGVEKIKTIGDCFMATAGLLDQHENPAAVAVGCGLEMIEAAKKMRSGWVLRLGIHIGPVIAGLVGVRRFAYDIWGDTVNVASRMESHGLPGAVHVSEDVYSRTSELFPWKQRGSIDIKNHGQMNTFLIQP